MTDGAVFMDVLRQGSVGWWMGKWFNGKSVREGWINGARV